jgi:hypothetical protein
MFGIELTPFIAPARGADHISTPTAFARNDILLPTPTAFTVTAQGGARHERNPGEHAPHDSSPNRADGCAGYVPCAPLGRGICLDVGPRVSPWAITVGPLGADKYIPTPTAFTVIAQGGARHERNPGMDPTPDSRPNGAGGCAGYVPCAPLGRGICLDVGPRVAPWAVTVGPVGAEEMPMNVNLEGLGYGG